MLFSAITYSRTKNLGNHESERMEVTIDVEPGDTPEFVAKTAKFWVETQLGLTTNLSAASVAQDPEDDIPY